VIEKGIFMPSYHVIRVSKYLPLPDLYFDWLDPLTGFKTVKDARDFIDQQKKHRQHLIIEVNDLGNDAWIVYAQEKN
jgi:hypothetical protein